ncbi:hypothetical protein PE067_17795 [Paracoccus sp. DMF-8]|uniref:hypothetical protein n=1 Tax=Paracoccus sp. DMF-8 TaxID=3019445 RepID=UPI0023E35AD6|nr:hypothetical protein [Paracoccus sp. DMF-8]MDF3607829.1 hypothetical protein [Paracoccus sp. DMF-8]
MKNVTDIKHAPSQIAAAEKARRGAEVAALTVLEQMYGYFSFDPMPLEAAERKAA